MTTTFRQRFSSRQPLLGTFIKTPSSHSTEILGLCGFDFVIIDDEHAAFSRLAIDTILLGAQATGVHALVRVAEASAARILAAFDDGAEGVVVPHVSNAGIAREIAASCRYRGGSRGFSNSPRAGGYGQLSLADHVTRSDQIATCVAMIEDPEAIDRIDEIVAVEGVHGFFIGRGDLAVAMGAASLNDPRVTEAARTVIAAAKRAGKPCCLTVANAAEAADWQTFGASAFVVSSDQGLLRAEAMRVRTEFSGMVGV